MTFPKFNSFGFSICILFMLSCNETVTDKGQPDVATLPASTLVNDTVVKVVQTPAEKNNTEPAVQTVEERPVAVLPAKEETRARQTPEAEPSNIRLGKYGCVASKYRNGEYEFIPRGSVILKSGGNYSYLGFEEPSTGKFETDAAGNILFHGGYLKDGKAEKTDREGKYLLTFPANPDNRWTMSFAD